MTDRSLAAEQFGAAATAYLSSAVHAQGADLERLQEVSRRLGAPEALDLGCGAGHAAFAMAKSGARVTAYDVSEEMLRVVQAEAGRRGLKTLQTRQGAAERLPFKDRTFDLAATRFSAHHWSDVPAALREMRRVIKDSGTLVFIDAIAPESPLFDTLLQTVELLRDASHVRDYRVSDWHAMLRDAGFAEAETDTWTLKMEFASWVARMRTPEVRVNAIRDVLAAAAPQAKAHFNVQPDGSFDLGVAWMQTQPRGRD